MCLSYSALLVKFDTTNIDFGNQKNNKFKLQHISTYWLRQNRGKEGKAKITYSGSVHANLVGKRFPVASGQEWAEMLIEATTNDAYAYLPLLVVTRITPAPALVP